MYVCICNAITDGEIQELVAQGCRSVGDVYRGLNCQPQCCKCTGEIRRLLKDADASQPADASQAIAFATI